MKNDTNYIHLNPPTPMLEEMEKCFGGVLFILSDFSLNSASEFVMLRTQNRRHRKSSYFCILLFGSGIGSCERIVTLKGITRTSVMFHKLTAEITVTSNYSLQTC